MQRFARFMEFINACVSGFFEGLTAAVAGAVIAFVGSLLVFVALVIIQVLQGNYVYFASTVRPIFHTSLEVLKWAEIIVPPLMFIAGFRTGYAKEYDLS